MSQDKQIEATINHYRSRPQRFWEGTKDHDVTQNYNAFLSALTTKEKLTILDFGCGPGRDLKYFSDLGHMAIGLDGSPEFCDMARQHSQCEVWNQNFLNLKLPSSQFDGIFANASLFHIPKENLKNTLSIFHKSLKPRGVLFMSNPRGQGEFFDGSRFGNYMQFEEYGNFLSESHFEILTHYYRPAGQPRENQPWLAIVSRKL